MYVACPSCKTLYRIQPEHLRLAGGRVRCGTCRTTFSAAGAVFEDPQQALACAEQTQETADDIDALISRALERVPSSRKPVGGSATEKQGEAEPQNPRLWTQSAATGSSPAVAAAEEAEAEPDFGMAVVEVGAEQAPDDIEAVDGVNEAKDDRSADESFEWSPSVPEQADTDTAAAPVPALEQGEAIGARRSAALVSDLDLYAQPSTGEFLGARRADEQPRPEVSEVLLLDDVYRERVSGRAWGAIAASLLLAGLLVVQYGYAERHRLAALPQLRPALEFACGHLGCDLPPRRDVGQVEILERQVRDHPGVDEALLINVSFVNKAEFAQAFPLFEVSFSDVSGTPVAVGRFTADEYLTDEHRGSKQMQPGEHARLMLEVIDPGERAVSFQFEFL
ncbi:MAG: DUF3426 domain-containing protein [Gammaproteobacteria bacterium]|jgi:predicted Zn finger-like uncharacterized protein